MNFKAVALLVLLGVAGSTAETVTTRLSLVEALSNNRQLTSLVEAVSQFPDLLEALGTFQGTVLAPNNNAFSAALAAAAAAGVNVDADTLKTILNYHLVTDGAYNKGDLTDGQALQTAIGPITVTFSDGEPTLNGVGSSAKVVGNDFKLTSGPSVMVIDTVLLPIELPAGMTPEAPAPMPAGEDMAPMFPDLITAATESNLTTLLAAVTIAGLTDDLVGFNGTVLAPTNAAFAAVIAALNLDINNLTEEQIMLLADVLKYHVIPAKAMAADLMDGQELETLLGEPVVVNVREDGVYFIDGNGGEAMVVAADVTAGDAVVHVIDQVLIPAMAPTPAPTPAPAPVSSASTLASAAAVAGSLLAAALLL